MRILSKQTTCASLALALASCAAMSHDEVSAFADGLAGKNLVGVSTGWAFVEAEADLENGTGPLANPLLGGSDVGSSTTDLDPVFGAGLKFLHFIDNHWSIGGIFEHRIFDPDPTRPLNAELDIDDFGTNHFIFDLRYWFNALDRDRRFRPFAAVQLGFVPAVNADGVVRYEAINSLGLPAVNEDIELRGDEFFTLGFLVGGSVLIQRGLTFDFGAFYEWALDPTEDRITLQPHPGAPVVGDPTSYDGELRERGLYLTVGLSYTF